MGARLEAADETQRSPWLAALAAQALPIVRRQTGAINSKNFCPPILMRGFPIFTYTHFRQQRHIQFGDTLHELWQGLLYQLQFRIRHFQY